MPLHVRAVRSESAHDGPHPVSAPANEHESPTCPAQAPPHSVPSPAQVRVPCGAPATTVHVPGVVPSHASHGPVQAVLQQKPSTHEPLAHSAFAAQVRPFFFLHAPAASHVFAPVHELGSSALATIVHAPVPVTQDMQVPVHAVAQQMP